MQSEIKDALTVGNKLEACRLAYVALSHVGGARARKKLREDLDALGVDRHLTPPPDLAKLEREVWEALRKAPRTMNELRAAVPHGDVIRSIKRLVLQGFVRMHKFRYEVM